MLEPGVFDGVTMSMSLLEVLDFWALDEGVLVPDACDLKVLPWDRLPL